MFVTCITVHCEEFDLAGIRNGSDRGQEWDHGGPTMVSGIPQKTPCKSLDSGVIEPRRKGTRDHSTRYAVSYISCVIHIVYHVYHEIVSR